MKKPAEAGWLDLGGAGQSPPAGDQLGT